MKKNFFFALIVLGFYSCTNESLDKESETNTGQEVDIYVAGYVSDLSNGIPAYWKNGKLVLIDSTHYNFMPDYGLQGARVNSIAVSGDNVYTVGVELLAGPHGWNLNDILWQNGIQLDLNGGSTGVDATSSIAVSGTDVYIVGSEYDFYTGSVAKYWKNGNPVNLPESTYANCIAVSGTEVYVAGYEVINSTLVAKYWKNGNPVILTDGNNVTSIAVSGSDVYVAGYKEDHNGNIESRYWKNGNLVNITGSTGNEVPNSIAVSGMDIYVAGYEYIGTSYYASAKYWKNDQAILLSDGTKDAFATSIAVSGNDVYVVGYEEKTADSYDYVVKFWKNGTPVILGDVSKYSASGANSIFLVKK